MLCDQIVWEAVSLKFCWHKINGVAIKGPVLSLSDGSAETVFDDIAKASSSTTNAINWTLFVSSSSDSAKEERIKADEQKYGPFKEGGVDLVKNSCAMHLGVNFRKAFVQATSPVDKDCSRHISSRVC